MIRRCTYHYLLMPAAVFGFVTLALAMSEWPWGQSSLHRLATGRMLGGIVLAFLYWLPLSLGLSPTARALQSRW
ncbi:hypothetical protein [Synechococcus sp. PCC 7335]|uniref:hypothetical protein n=1 Tax=Synechococcus sp. (strain ATCC 29403 / PCC 7335) TaxID=91464 RepID=UPI0008FECE3A|nr:hypothetical protein [Synechococcus sp. PCC 7335]